MKPNRFSASSAPPHIGQLLLKANLSINELRAMSPFEENAQKIIDQAVVEVGLDRLVVAADIMSAGLTYNLPNALSVMEVQWERTSHTGGAQRTMSPSARGENQLFDRDVKRVPIYLTTDDFSVGIRTLQMSQRIGAPIDTAMVSQATRRVNEAIEDAMINGAGIQSDGYTTYGLLNAPNANPYIYQGGGAGTPWTDGGKSGQEILDDAMDMIEKLQADKKYGPYTLYVNTAYGNALNMDFKANGSLTILQRLLELRVGGSTLNVVSADKIPTDYTILVQKTSDVVDIIMGQSPTVIPWTSADGFTLYWMVMAIVVPRVRDDYDGNSGICIGFTS